MKLSLRVAELTVETENVFIDVYKTRKNFNLETHNDSLHI